jgi:hypothetical protein
VIGGIALSVYKGLVASSLGGVGVDDVCSHEILKMPTRRWWNTR